MAFTTILCAALLAQAGPACFDRQTTQTQATMDARKFGRNPAEPVLLLSVPSVVSIRVQQVADEIVSHTGMTSNFTMVAADVSNAMAYIDSNGKRMVLYNPKFMERVSHHTCKDWAITGVLAHEIAHHLKGHVLHGPDVDIRKLQMEADDFTGFIMYRLGANIEQTQRATANLTYSEDTPASAGTAQRMAALRAGWMRAQQIASDEGFYDEQRRKHAVSQQGR